ncbi:MAG: hypothetical protein COX82_02715 [Candidatus Magasanikbacteria bacterium CG_4_10_14_0_2_um_filter_41_10]|uniref:Uncharacterized protein n=1 Tax=Candidatus Magasanikbacteria bacterium CG_4_10_14_0_2_um_filter_41_10 TaxID=1974638 RepID=A0A2M7V490_9BACT|nr:MAG: hypothetical protein COX82_02715 [Candidatus Magasanikbacteria bacterium CG_4_10_14_0_2_um_filter_41_10]
MVEKGTHYFPRRKAFESETEEELSLIDLDPRVERRMEIRSKCAELGVRLDQYLSEHPDGNFDDFISQNDVEDIPDEVLATYKKVIEKYIARNQDTTHAYQLIIKQDVGEVDTSAVDSSTVGNAFFQKFCNGEQPEAEVRLSLGEGFLLFEFDSQKDYLLFKKTRESSVGLSTEGITAPCGEFGYIDIHTLREKTPYVALRTDSKRSRAEQRSTLVHERQHFIDKDILETFDKVRPTGELPYRTEEEKAAYWKRHSIKRWKDEFLCRIRENESFVEIGKEMKYSYANLFEDVSEFQDASDELQKICALLNKTDIFDGEERRTYLLYQLVDVTFYNIAHRIELLVSHHALQQERKDKKESEISELCFESLALSEEVDSELLHVYPSDKKKDSRHLVNEVKDLRRLVRLLQGNKEELAPDTRLQKIRSLQKKYKEVKNQLDERQDFFAHDPRVRTMEYNRLVSETDVSHILGALTHDPDTLIEMYGDAKSGSVVPDVSIELRGAINSLLPEGIYMKSLKVIHINPNLSRMDLALIVFDDEFDIKEKILIRVPIE